MNSLAKKHAAKLSSASRTLTLERKYKEKLDESIDPRYVKVLSDISKSFSRLNFKQIGLNSFEDVKNKISDKSFTTSGLSNVFKSGNEIRKKGIYNSLGFLDAIQNYFEALGIFLEPYGESVEGAEQMTVEEVLKQASEGKEKQGAISKFVKGSSDPVDILTNLTKEAFKPDDDIGEYSGLSSKFINKKGKAITQEILNANYGSIEKLANDVNAELKNVKSTLTQIDKKNAANTKGSSSNKKTDPSKTSKETGSSIPTSDGTTQGGTTPKKVKAAERRASNVYSKIKDQLGNINQDDAIKVISTMILSNNKKS